MRTICWSDTTACNVMPNFKWSSKRPGALEARMPGRAFRLTAFGLVVCICALLLYFGGPSQAVLIIIVLCSPLIALIAPEVVESWSWWVGKAEEHAVDRVERIFRFGYTDIRMLMVDENPWFAAADVGSALGFADIDQETRRFDVAKCNFLGGELYLSEAGVTALIAYSRHRDTRSFKIWFEREVMFPLNRAREARQPD
jgi:hypothetical protein